MKTIPATSSHATQRHTTLIMARDIDYDVTILKAVPAANERLRQQPTDRAMNEN
jgi:hypothetical protein